MTTKIHALIDGRYRPLVLPLTADNVNDTTQFAPLMADLRVARPGRGRPVGFDKGRYKRRNVVERGFCQLEHWRGLATRYDRHARTASAP